MDEETFNLSIRKFLKIVDVNSQREIERAVRKALEEGRIQGDETFPARGRFAGCLMENYNYYVVARRVCRGEAILCYKQ